MEPISIYLLGVILAMALIQLHNTKLIQGIVQNPDLIKHQKLLVGFVQFLFLSLLSWLVVAYAAFIFALWLLVMVFSMFMPGK